MMREVSGERRLVRSLAVLSAHVQACVVMGQVAKRCWVELSVDGHQGQWGPSGEIAATRIPVGIWLCAMRHIISDTFRGRWTWKISCQVQGDKEGWEGEGRRGVRGE